MKSRDDKEIERLLGKPQIEDLAYWKGRLVEAKGEYDDETTKANRENLLLCKRMVSKIEFYVLRKTY
jgi:hypothetical protein